MQLEFLIGKNVKKFLSIFLHNLMQSNNCKVKSFFELAIIVIVHHFDLDEYCVLK